MTKVGTSLAKDEVSLDEKLEQLLGPLSPEERERIFPWLVLPIVESAKPGEAVSPALRLYVNWFITQRLGLSEETDSAVLQDALRKHSEKNPPNGSVLTSIGSLLREALRTGGTATLSKTVATLIGRHEAVAVPTENKGPSEGQVRAGPFAAHQLTKEK